MSGAALIFLLASMLAAMFGYTHVAGAPAVEVRAAFFACLLGFVFFLALGPERLSGRRSRRILAGVAVLCLTLAVAAGLRGFTMPKHEEETNLMRSVFYVAVAAFAFAMLLLPRRRSEPE